MTQQCNIMQTHNTITQQNMGGLANHNTNELRSIITNIKDPDQRAILNLAIAIYKHSQSAATASATPEVRDVGEHVKNSYTYQCDKDTIKKDAPATTHVMRDVSLETHTMHNTRVSTRAMQDNPVTTHSIRDVSGVLQRYSDKRRTHRRKTRHVNRRLYCRKCGSSSHVRSGKKNCPKHPLYKLKQKI